MRFVIEKIENEIGKVLPFGNRVHNIASTICERKRPAQLKFVLVYFFFRRYLTYNTLFAMIFESETAGNH